MAIEYKSIDEEINDVVDVFDGTIAPKRVWRNDNNKIYLLLKSIAAGMNKIRGVVLALRNRFDPHYCEDADLYSTALLVGTTPRGGAGSLLRITITNRSTEEQKTLPAGEYHYVSTSGMPFRFELATDTLFEGGEVRTVSAISAEKGAYAVSENSRISVVRADGSLPDPSFAFSCLDNAGQLGYPDEDAFAFRQRILNDGNRQDQIKEIEHAIRGLPNIFECNLILNPGEEPQEYDGITLAPLELLVVLTGAPTAKIAEIVAQGCLYATHKVDDEHVLYHENPLYLGGKYPVYYKLHDMTDFELEIVYQVDRQKFKPEQVEAAINTLLSRYTHAVTHVDVITEKHIYNLLDSLNMANVVIMDVNILSGGEQIPYLTIPGTRIPHLTAVSYTPILTGGVL
jgi:hypothetical protein